MIALGESVLRVGLTFGSGRWSLSVDASFLVGFVLTAALWAMYFLRHAELGTRAMSASPADAARLGRAGYAYAHAIMVAGVIVIAVAIRLTILKPGGASTVEITLTMLGAVAIAADRLVLACCATFVVGALAVAGARSDRVVPAPRAVRQRDREHSS